MVSDRRIVVARKTETRVDSDGTANVRSPGRVLDPEAAARLDAALETAQLLEQGAGVPGSSFRGVFLDDAHLDQRCF